jgi:hypothetical protein
VYESEDAWFERSESGWNVSDGEDSARSKDENVTVRELLLELACETGDLSGMALRRD